MLTVTISDVDGTGTRLTPDCIGCQTLSSFTQARCICFQALFVLIQAFVASFHVVSFIHARKLLVKITITAPSYPAYPRLARGYKALEIPPAVVPDPAVSVLELTRALA